MQSDIEKKQRGDLPDTSTVETKPQEKTTQKSGGISLKNLSKLKEKVKQEHHEQNAKAAHAQNVEIPFEGFLKTWNDFAIEAREKGKKSLHMLMTASEPTYRGRNSFQIKVATETLKETFNAEKMHLVDKIGDKFGTTLFEINVEIVEVSEDEKTKFLATPKEKYDHMVKINPELKNLMEELGLDFNF
ncbi:MAG: hypothetical protein ACPGLV_05400 [Bacteroidia bacterium]